MNRAPMTAAAAIEQMRRVGIGVDLVGGVVLLAGGSRHARAVWRPVVRRMRQELIAVLAPAATGPTQAELPGVGE